MQDNFMRKFVMVDKRAQIMVGGADLVDQYQDIVDRILSSVFELNPQEVLVTDLSDVSDFTCFIDDADFGVKMRKIEAEFCVSLADLKSPTLVEVAQRIREAESTRH
jgi:hypothetical protein